MAYTEELVSELSHSVSKETCCRLSMLSAIVKIDGSIHLGAKSAISLGLKISNMALARRIISEFKSLFGLHSEVNLRRINIRGTTQSQILIKSNQLRAVLEKLEVLQAGKLNFGMPKNLIKRTCCKSYFLRGAFMAGGYVNQSAAHLEISSENKKLIVLTGERTKPSNFFDADFVIVGGGLGGIAAALSICSSVSIESISASSFV